ncbi:MAG TPA: quinate 5-dehydrogenase, partial [Chthonomonadales bacterium]|nr:quinate 5-dehydrogenase [Chthonomonadales bacterium]
AYLQDKAIVDFTQKSVLLVSAVDRFGMAEALSQRAKSIVFGDMLFGFGLNIPFRSWKTTQKVARIVLPVVVQLPFKWVYPTGEKQERNTPKFSRYFNEADVIAGDFHYINKYMPVDMRGKIILTNTTTQADVEVLTRRGAACLITTTPVLDGRSFGTNVMEAVLVVLLNKRPEELTAGDYLAKLKELGWAPQVQELHPAVAAVPSTV